MRSSHSDAPAIFVTGANGFLGSFVTRSLLRRGCRVLAGVRGGEARSPAAAWSRLVESLAEIGCGEAELSALAAGGRLEALHLDLLEPGAGLSQEARERLRRSRPLTVVHTAASLRHSAKRAEETRAINVDGTAKLLEACRELGIPHFTLVGTAYVHGRASGVMRESLYPKMEPLNYYDRTKWEQERLVDASGLPYRIFRPSILMGPYDTGVGRGLDSYYGFVWGLFLLAEAHAGRAGHPERVPLRVRANPRASVNVIPTDWAGDAIATAAERSEGAGGPQIVHLTDDAPRDLAEHVVWMAQGVGRIEVTIRSPESFPAEAFTIYDLQFEQMIDFQKAYIQEDVRYDASMRRELGLPDPPPVDAEVMLRLIRHARGRFERILPRYAWIVERLRATAPAPGPGGAAGAPGPVSPTST